jgi:hypothetical protein
MGMEGLGFRNREIRETLEFREVDELRREGLHPRYKRCMMDWEREHLEKVLRACLALITDLTDSDEEPTPEGKKACRLLMESTEEGRRYLRVCEGYGSRNIDPKDIYNTTLEICRQVIKERKG